MGRLGGRNSGSPELGAHALDAGGFEGLTVLPGVPLPTWAAPEVATAVQAPAPAHAAVAALVPPVVPAAHWQSTPNPKFATTPAEIATPAEALWEGAAFGQATAPQSTTPSAVANPTLTSPNGFGSPEPWAAAWNVTPEPVPTFHESAPGGANPFSSTPPLPPVRETPAAPTWSTPGAPAASPAAPAQWNPQAPPSAFVDPSHATVPSSLPPTFAPTGFAPAPAPSAPTAFSAPSAPAPSAPVAAPAEAPTPWSGAATAPAPWTTADPAPSPSAPVISTSAPWATEAIAVALPDLAPPPLAPALVTTAPVAVLERGQVGVHPIFASATTETADSEVAAASTPRKRRGRRLALIGLVLVLLAAAAAYVVPNYLLAPTVSAAVPVTPPAPVPALPKTVAGLTLVPTTQALKALPGVLPALRAPFGPDQPSITSAAYGTSEAPVAIVTAGKPVAVTTSAALTAYASALNTEVVRDGDVATPGLDCAGVNIRAKASTVCFWNGPAGSGGATIMDQTGATAAATAAALRKAVESAK